MLCFVVSELGLHCLHNVLIKGIQSKKGYYCRNKSGSEYCGEIEALT